ncbi:chitin synthase-domain-containing protein [Xylariaceae sp. FL0255]|nr:chitin synthase-domain-containing protein [Xylariaceae sp. FL0255]
MVFFILVFLLRNRFSKMKKNIPQEPESIVMLMPCYNETLEECTKSLDSLVRQQDIESHPRGILVICDGKARGPGMEKTTAQYLNEDILVDQTARQRIPSAYIAWDRQLMNIEISRGTYKGVPFFCIVKEQNQGKRDSLILSRSFLYNFNRRHTGPHILLRPDFFFVLADWLVQDCQIEQADLLIGMDADTVFACDCVANLVSEVRYPGTVGVCGYVTVDFTNSKWNLWAIYQSAEYTIAQGLRRLHQSLVTKKVSCLPGCYQLIRVCNETCGDDILVNRFGYHPRPTDGIITRIRATASEDRNHVCHMLIKHPEVHTRQALKARAYTDVPKSVAVFASQRRRWTLGATSNDLMLFLAAPFRFNWFERFVALANVMTWCLAPFVAASMVAMIHALMYQTRWKTLLLVGIMLIPYLYYLSMAVWMCRNALERTQFMLGLLIFTIIGPIINILIMVYAIYCMDNFGWGKTRKIVANDDEKICEAEESDPDDRLSRIHGAVSLRAPDLENQAALTRTPFRVPFLR